MAGQICGYRGQGVGSSNGKKEKNEAAETKVEGEEDLGSNTQWQTQNPNSTISLILTHINGSFCLKPGGQSSIPKLVLTSNFLKLDYMLDCMHVRVMTLYMYIAVIWK